MKISICIPTYNQSQYLIQAVNSANRQTLGPSEIIVSNDCSTDDTSDVLEKISNEIPILKVLHQSTNLGIAKNTDSCLRAATGDFVVRLDSDDYLSPFYCEKLSNLLVDFPDAGYAHGAVQEINQYGENMKLRWLSRPTGYESGSVGLRAASRGYRVAANIIMFRRSALEQVNYITDRPDYVEDFHLSASLSAAGFGNVYLNEVLSNYRVWVDSGKTRQRRKLMEINGVKKVFEEVLEPEYKKRSWNRAKLEWSKGSFACRNSDCLGWEVYTKDEKEELGKALTALSPSVRTKIYGWLFLNGYGESIIQLNKVKGLLKTSVKQVLFPYTSREKNVLAAVDERDV